MATKTLVQNAFSKGEGVFSMVPCWVPRSFNRPGKRLRLHPDDYYSFGVNRGAIVERWFASTTRAMAPGAAEDDGLSYISTEYGNVLFRDAMDDLGADLIGAELKETYGKFPMYAKFFDYQGPLFHHLHQGQEHAESVGMNSKPEHYYFPVQYNNHLGDFPVTYFGFDPSIKKEEVLECLLDFNNFDTHITRLSRAFRLELGTGWYTPPRVLHAPGSLLTYEPQWNSDVVSVWENVVSGEAMNYNLLSACVLEDRVHDIDYIFGQMDWDANICPDYRARYFRPPLQISKSPSHEEKWICYGNEYIGGKELIIYPGQTYISKDIAAYGAIVIQGYGSFGAHRCESATLIRFGQQTADEFFVSEDAAKKGITITNRAIHEPLVILKHFGPNCGMPREM